MEETMTDYNHCPGDGRQVRQSLRRHHWGRAWQLGHNLPDDALRLWLERENSLQFCQRIGRTGPGRRPDLRWVRQYLWNHYRWRLGLRRHGLRDVSLQR